MNRSTKIRMAGRLKAIPVVLLSALIVFIAILAPTARAETSLYTLPRLIELALSENRVLAAARAQADSARAGIVTARALPNPEMEIMSGPQRARVPGALAGNSSSITVTQRIDLPPQRKARIDTASANLDAVQAQVRATERELVRNIKLRYFELVRRQSELDAAEQDLVTSNQIHERVSVRVSTGEAPRYDLFKADAELLSAQKQVQGARLRVLQAVAALRQAVGAHLPDVIEVLPPTEPVPDLPSLAQLQQQALQTNPDLARDRALAQRARSQLNFEKSARLPSLALRAGVDQDPETRSQRLGLVVSVPLWDRRAGPVAEAAAQLNRYELEQAQRELDLRSLLETAYRQAELSRNQVAALESGILRQAEAALRVAEAAYRFGERGILDYLDAQRVYRGARNELIAARYELSAALIEIERLQSP